MKPGTRINKKNLHLLVGKTILVHTYYNKKDPSMERFIPAEGKAELLLLDGRWVESALTMWGQNSLLALLAERGMTHRLIEVIE